jgi:hypothetical protein
MKDRPRDARKPQSSADTTTPFQEAHLAMLRLTRTELAELAEIIWRRYAILDSARPEAAQ